MSNLGSISEQSLAGAISTGTHGTGAKFGIISSQVLEMRIILADGSVRTLCRDNESKDMFLASLCSLGALGIISTITLQAEPAYNLAYEEFLITFTQLETNWDALINSAQLVRFWWFPYTETVLVWRAARTKRVATASTKSWWSEKFIGYHLLEYLLYLSSFMPSLLPKLNAYYAHKDHSMPTKDFKVEPFNDADPKCTVGRHVDILNFDCLFKQHVTEWCAPSRSALTALQSLKSKIDQDSQEPNGGGGRKIHAHFPVEIRFVKGDDIWLSPAYGDGVFCYIGIIVYRPYGQEAVPRQAYWTAYEDSMKSVDARPHWAKAFPLRYRELAKLYPMFERFCQMRRQLDPNGLFMNEYTRRHLTPPDSKAKL